MENSAEKESGNSFRNSWPAPHCLPSRPVAGFTLIELIGVVAILGVMLLLVLPSTGSLLRSRSATTAAYEMAGLLEQARAFAIANHTHVFVGILEENADLPSSAPHPRIGIGRVLMAVFASSDGTKGYENHSAPDTNWRAQYRKGANLRLLGTLKIWENLHVAATLGRPPEEGAMARPEVNYYYRLGHSSCRSVTPISWPLGSSLDSAFQYRFDKVIRFDPTGTPRIQYRTNEDTIVQWMEIGIQQTRGTHWEGFPASPNTGNQTAILLDGITGAIRVYRPM